MWTPSVLSSRYGLWFVFNDDPIRSLQRLVGLFDEAQAKAKSKLDDKKVLLCGPTHYPVQLPLTAYGF